MNQPAGKVTKITINSIDPKFYPQLYAAVVAEYRRTGRMQVLNESTSEYSAYLDRARQRLGVLQH
jgi:hypothetical protein